MIKFSRIFFIDIDCTFLILFNEQFNRIVFIKPIFIFLLFCMLFIKKNKTFLSKIFLINKFININY